MCKLRKNNTGYDIKQCFVGSEGTLGIVTGAVLRLAPQPIHRATAWLKLAADAPLAELLALIRRESADLLTTFEFMTARSIVLASEAMTNPPAVRAGPGGAVLAEFASSSRHLDLDGLMEAVLRSDRVRMDRGRLPGAKRIAADRDVGGTRKHP